MVSVLPYEKLELLASTSVEAPLGDDTITEICGL